MSVTLSDTQTLATTSLSQAPVGIALDVPSGGYYVDTSTGVPNDTTANEILFGSSLISPETLTDAYNVPDQDGGTETLPTEGIVVEVQPVVDASGTVTFVRGGGAIEIDSGATVSDADGYYLASATVSIASGFGLATCLHSTAAHTPRVRRRRHHHRQLQFRHADADRRRERGELPGGAGQRDLLDHQQHETQRPAPSIGPSATASSAVRPTTSTVDVHVPPTMAAGATATFDGGGSAVVLDSNISLTAFTSTLASATVSIVSPLTGDTLNFTNTSSSTEGNIAVSSDVNGRLVLSSSGDTATLSQWKSALDAVTYSFTPSNGDPTDGGSDTSRTIDWTVNDGTLTSTTATSALDTVHVAPVATAGGTVNFTGGGGPVTLDSGLTLTDVDSSGMLSSASVTIVNAASTDRLNFNDQNGITGSYDTSTGVLTLTGDASIGNYRTALESVTYSVSPTNSDPTDGGGDTSRTIDWTVNDGTSTSNTATSTLDTVHVAPTVTASGTVHFGFGGPPVTLDSMVTASDVDSGGNLSSATVSIGTGFVSGDDTLNFANKNGISGSYDQLTGVLSLSGSASIAFYQQALDSVSFDTTSTTTGSRVINWTVGDGVLNSDVANSTVDVAPCYCPGTLIKTKRGQKKVEKLKIGDKVMTASGEARPIKWIGRRSYSGRFVMGRKDVLPVCIRAGALEDKVPKRDLWISPNHAMYLDGVLIEAKDLVNGVSIVQTQSPESVEYYHVELDTHDVLIAEGAPAESYIDDDNRSLFHNAHEYREKYPDQEIGPAQYYAPRCDSGYELETVRQRIALRAGLVASDEATPIGNLRGFIDRITGECVSGWAQNLDHPEAPVCLDVVAGGLLLGQVLANRYREDLERAGIGSGCHSFEFTLPPEPIVAANDIVVCRSLDGVALELTIEAWRMLRQNTSHQNKVRRAVA